MQILLAFRWVKVLGVALMLPGGTVVLVEEAMEGEEEEVEEAISRDLHMTPCISQDRWAVEVVILPVVMEAGVEVTAIKIYSVTCDFQQSGILTS